MSYIIGILGIIGAMIGWVLVQQLWRKVFADQVTDSDVLSMRSSCGTGSCGCTVSCKVKNKKKNISNIKINTH